MLERGDWTEAGRAMEKLIGRGRVLFDARWKGLAAMQCLLVGALGIALAFWWRPAPHSDWEYYWSAAGAVSAYERGGLSLWLLALPKALGWPPVASALALNLPAATTALLLAWRADPTHWRLMAQATAVYLLLITPFFGIVQLDLIAAAELGLGLWFAAGRDTESLSRLRFVLAVGAVAFAVSTRPQYALVIWTLVPLVTVLMALRGRPDSRALILLGVLLTGSLVGFVTDMTMRHASGRTEQIRTSSAVTLYAGLLVSGDRRDQKCGHWTEYAALAAKKDLALPISGAVRKRLSARPIGHWISVLACKAPHIVSPPPYALYWLIESPNIRERVDARPDRERFQERYTSLRRIEKRVYRVLSFCILVMCAWTALRMLRTGSGWGWFTVTWILAFWSVHTVFEIQGRYFLGMYLLAPLWCALVLRRGGAGAANATASPAAGRPRQAAQTGG